MLFRLLTQYLWPSLFTVVLHTVLVLAMLTSWGNEPQNRQVNTPNYVQAQLVKLEDRPQSQKPKEDKPKIVDLTKKRQEQARQEKLAEQKRQRELKRQREAEQKRQAEAKKKAEEARKKREQEAKAAEEQRQAQLRQQREQEAFAEALAQEQAALAEESYAMAAQSYKGAISQRIRQNWSRPPSARKGMQCTLSIKLVPTGRVINVDLIESSGNDAFDRSAIQAVKRAEQFPEVKEMEPEVFERYYRELELIFKPQDLRQ